MTDLPIISVTTATWNCEKTLPKTFESVLAQDYPNVEHVVMDGASKDSTVEVIKSYEGRYAERGYSFVWRSEPDSGMYDAINKGMSLSKGEILGNINGDDVYMPGAFAKVVDVYSKKGFDAFQANLLIKTGSGDIVKKARPMGLYETSRKWNHPTLFLANEGLSYRYRLDNPYADYDLMLRVLHDKLHVEYLDEVLSQFNFGGMSTKKSLREMGKRLRWQRQILRDNDCSPFSYIEGFLIELAKLIKA